MSQRLEEKVIYNYFAPRNVVWVVAAPQDCAWDCAGPARQSRDYRAGPAQASSRYFMVSGGNETKDVKLPHVKVYI